MRKDRLLERSTFTEWARHVEAGISSHAATPVCAVMRRGVPTVRKDVGEDTLAEFMIEHECWELPVLDERGRLAGIVTAADLLRASVDGPELEPPRNTALPAGFHTMTTKIWSLFQFPPKPELAAAASLPLLVLTVLLLRAEHMILGRRGYSVVGGKYGAPRLIPLHGLRWAAFALCLLMLMMPVFLPYFALLNAAFSPVATTFVTFKTATWQNVHFVLFELSAMTLALKNTIILGTAAATAGTAIALVIAYVTARQAVTGWRVLGFLATAPIAIPGIVLGVGLFLSYTRPPFVLYGTLWILLIAFVTIALPSAYQQLQAAFRTIHPELEDASRILGATRLRSLWQITAPLLRTGVVATWCFIFVGVMRELSAAIILFTSETKVLSVLIYDLNESGDLGAISVIGLGMLIITFAVVIAVNRIPGFGTIRFIT